MNADNTVENDIAYLRGLAEEGRRGPVLGGGVMFVSGVIYSLAALASWAIHTGRAPIDIPNGAEWWTAMAVQVVILAVMIPALARGRASPGAVNSRMFGAIWQIVGFTIAVAFLSLSLIHKQYKDEMIWMATPVFVMAIYGAGWAIAGALVKRPWMYLVSGFSFAAAVLTAYIVRGAEGLLLYALIIFLNLALPGLLLMREKPLDATAA